MAGRDPWETDRAQIFELAFTAMLLSKVVFLCEILPQSLNNEGYFSFTCATAIGSPVFHWLRPRGRSVPRSPICSCLQDSVHFIFTKASYFNCSLISVDARHFATWYRELFNHTALSLVKNLYCLLFSMRAINMQSSPPPKLQLSQTIL